MDVQRGERREGGRQPSGQPECIETTVAFNPTASSLLPAHGGRLAEGPGPEEGQHGDHHQEKARQKQSRPGQRGPGSELGENKHEAKHKTLPSPAGPGLTAGRMHGARPIETDAAPWSGHTSAAPVLFLLLYLTWKSAATLGP